MSTYVFIVFDLAKHLECGKGKWFFSSWEVQYSLKYMLILESSLMNWKFKCCLKRPPTEFIDLLLGVWLEGDHLQLTQKLKSVPSILDHETLCKLLKTHRKDLIMYHKLRRCISVCKIGFLDNKSFKAEILYLKYTFVHESCFKTI